MTFKNLRFFGFNGQSKGGSMSIYLNIATCALFLNEK